MGYCDFDLDQYIYEDASFRALMSYKMAEQLSFYICAILQQVMSGLIFIHSRDRVHRDIKLQGCNAERIPVLTPERGRLTWEPGTRCVSGEKPVQHVFKPLVAT
jgi:serine/threonine protein kinase